MIKRKNYVYYLMISLVMGIIIFGGFQIFAKAAVLPDKYCFVYNGANHDTGSDLELKQNEVLLSVTAVTGGTNTWATDTSVTWVSSETGVIDIDPNTAYGSNFCKLIRRGPGYSTITAIIKQGTSSMSISCRMKVDLQYDYGKIGVNTATTVNEKILALDMSDAKQRLYLKYADYTTQTTAVSGDAITATLVDWTSSNPGVATVDSDGYVTPIGAGSTDITVATNTVSSKDNALTATIRVVVAPKFSVTYGTNSIVVNSVDKENKVATGTANGVPSNFTIASNATLATNLTWKIVDFSNGNTVTSSSTGKMTYTISKGNGDVVFSKVKAGTYDVYAFADSKYDTGASAPYAYMRIVVPFDIGDISVVMDVNDTYSIIDNSNITDVSDFSYDYVPVNGNNVDGNENIALIDSKTSIITARMKGTVKIRLRYVTGKKLYDNASVVVNDQYITVTVIDGISLSMTSAKLYTKGTLLLDAITTDSSNSIIWSTSDSAIATVDSGLVTAGTKTGTVAITAKQTVNGVMKKATCTITVQQSVNTITIDPTTVTLPIDSYKTLHATITPSINGVSLQWKSSDPSVVKIVESSALTATIQAVDGGHAVISAINQDNVVVGYCHVTVQKSVESITLSSTSVSALLSSKQYQLTATVLPDVAVNKIVNWSTTDTSKAKVDANGLVTFVSAGTVSIIATSADSPSIRAICNINIQVPTVSVSLTETSKIMYVGQTAKLAYTLLPTTASINTVTWTSTNTAVATVDATGKVTAKSVGTTVIILKTLDGGYSAFCTITVKSIATGIKLTNAEMNLKTGEYAYIKVELTPKNSTENELVYESSDTKVAIVDEAGKVTAKKAGVAVITVRTQAGAVAYCKVTVTEAVGGLILNYTDKTIYKGSHFQLEVSVTPSSATNLAVTWISSNTKVATIDKNGDVKGLQGGTTVITCKTTDGGYSAICVVTVRELVTTVTLNHTSLGIGKGKSTMLKATATTETASNSNVSWKSSNKKVVNVSKKGKVTGLSYGHATITAIAKDGSEAEASCYVSVVKPVTRLTINRSYMLMMVGDSKKLKATITPKNATYHTAKWTSSDKSVAIVDDSGVVTAFKAGSTTITSEAKDSSGRKAICFIDVRERVSSTGITAMDKKLVMVSGEQKVVQVSLAPATSTDECVWSSDNSAVASVNKTTGRITANSVGTAAITVMTDSGKTAVIEITVIGLSVTQLRLEQYTEYTLTVEGTTSAIKWDISNPKIATVTNGVVSTKATGTATITATVNGRKLICHLKVVKIK